MYIIHDRYYSDVFSYMSQTRCVFLPRHDPSKLSSIARGVAGNVDEESEIPEVDGK